MRGSFRKEHRKQCDQMWQNVATFAKKLKSLAKLCGLFTFWPIIEPALVQFNTIGQFFIVCQWPNIEEIIYLSCHTDRKYFE